MTLTKDLGYLYTCSKNDVSLNFRKHYCALELGLRLAEYFSVKRIFEQVESTSQI